MEKIESFKIDHTRLERGLYVSRTDGTSVAVTTFDLRMTRPNREPVMDMPAVHTIEHLGATFLRSHARRSEVIYFGPMGCRTGFYLVMFGALKPDDVFDLIVEMCDYILGYIGTIPGASSRECGNWREQNLDTAKYYIAAYKADLVANKRFKYPV